MNENLYALTNPQKSIWFTEEYFKGTSMENICGSVIIPKKVNLKILEKAINKFVELNDSFRLSFVLDNGVLKQYVNEAKYFSIDTCNISSDEELKNVERSLCDTPFNIYNSLLFSFKLLKFQDGHGGFNICIHHLISDAWTTGFGASEIIKIYAQLLQNESNTFEPNPSYIDYIQSENEYLCSSKFEKDKAFWIDRYSTIPEVASIPSINKADKNSSNIACRKQFELTSEFMEHLTSYCKQNKFSVFNLFMAVLAIYVGRTSNLDDFVLGTPILNRANFKEKHTTGMFVSTIPLRVNIDHDLSFIDFATQISSDFFSIFKHSKYPYQYLLEELRKNENIPNLYNIMLSYQNIRSSAQNDEIPFEISWVPNKYTADDLDIHLYDMNGTGTINIAYDYKVDKYSSQEIEATHNRLMHIIKQITENNSISLKDIEIVTPEEKKQILVDFNNTKTNYPKDKTIAQLFEEQVEKNPNNIAVVFEEQKLTYKELNEKANSLANYLIENDIKENDVVAIYLDKSINYVVSLLASLKIGSTFLPISKIHPATRVEYILNNSKCKLLISENKLVKNITFSCKYFDIANVPNKNTANLNFSFSSSNIAYILYTSGTTGNPKGVKITNYSVINHVYGINAKFSNTILPVEHCLSIANMSFDAHLQEIFIPLLCGSSLYLLHDSDIYNINYLVDYIVDNKITFSFLPPNILDDVYNLLSKKNNVSLNKLLVGVESIRNSTLSKYLLLNNKMLIHNGYGPTEATICCISYVYSKFSKIIEDNSFAPIGTPLANTKVLLVHSATKKIQPIGVPGEICISGDCISAGYVDTTLNKFFNDNYFNEVNYCTGDFAYYLNNGNIMFLGRKDNQIKLNGHRIELQEINQNIQSFSRINKCVSILNGKHIISYFTSDIKVDLLLLRKFLEAHIPTYMIPFKFIQLDAFPLTENGKIDFKHLPIPSLENSAKLHELPETETEKQLFNLFSELLQTTNFGITDNFFELGGDSLLAIKLSLMIKETFILDISVSELFLKPTIKTLALHIDSFVSASIKPCNISNIALADYYPVSSAQKRIYFSSLLAGNDSSLYNISGGIILDKTIDTSKLENCFNILIKRHESLRTYFEMHDKNVVQKVKDKVDFSLAMENLPSIDRLNSSFKNFTKPFDLSVAPLLRAKLINLPNNSCALFFDMHHIISDGTSMSILINELCELYNGNTLKDLKITYKDFAVLENNELASGKLSEAESYWVNQFNNEIPVLNMPSTYQRPAVQNFEGKKVCCTVDRNTTKNITKLANSLGVTPYMLLLASYYILLYKYTMQNDIVVGTPIVGRDMSETYDLIGMFVNTLALKNKIDSNLSFKDYLLLVKEMCLNAYKYQTYPFDELVNKLSIKRDTSRNPLFDTMFIYQNIGNPNITFDGINAKYYIPETNISKFDLSLEIIPSEDGLNLSFEYCTKLFDNNFIVQLSNHYLNILTEILSDVDVKIADIDMLSSNEMNTILNVFNATELDYPKEETISQLFEEQVKKAPNNIALVFEKQKLTYKELNEKANSLAHYLIDNHIEKDDIVGIMLPRSLELIVSILAVIKCGGTYVLVDDAFPEDRKSYILNNSNAKLLLTSNKNFDYKAKILFDTSLLLNNQANLEYTSNSLNNFAIIYTSGSTGLPKGVLLHQQGLINLIHAFDTLMDISKYKNHLGLASISFDMFAVETFTSLLFGRTLYLLNEEELKNPILTSNIIKDNKIEFIITTPTKIELLLSSTNTADCLQCVKAMQLGGEVFTRHLYSKLLEYTHAKIYNGYGPTEITACCSNKLITSPDNINIGKPIPNMQIYILDANKNICPVGIPGEIYIAGIGVSNGYVDNIKKTNESFVYCKYSKSIVYKTGDIAKYLPNGDIDYIGRNDFQIKLHGLRIELSEIENQIVSLDYINYCVVIPNENNTYLKAFFVANDTLSIPAIREKLALILPSYMIPKYFFQIDNIPYTNNGKIDKIALNDIRSNIEDENIFYVAPENELQQILCSLWENILKTKIGIDNNLFDLGADSLSAIQFKVDALNHNIDIPYADIFKYKTIRKLSELKGVTIDACKIDEYDYSEINKLLKKQPKKNLKITTSKCNNLLLLGCNGFVGMHIINSFIQNDNGNIYCIIRSKNGKPAINRFMEILHFYFNTSLDNLINKRIFVFDGDVLKRNLGLSATDFDQVCKSINVVINAAANVKHFGDFNKFKAINIDATNNIIEFCERYSKRFIHLSTLSVSGNMFLDGSISVDKLQQSKKAYFFESNLFINQSLDNVYTRSKFIAERTILQHIIHNNLDAQILRLGNITSRYSDGVFQKNVYENAFATKLRSLILLGYIPKSLLKQLIEFTPVDLCADSIIFVLQNKASKLKILHIYNPNHIKLFKIFNVYKKLNNKIKIISDVKFAIQISNTLKNPNLRRNLDGIINDLSKNKQLNYYSNIYVKSDLSLNFLNSCNFKWPKITSLYLQKYISYLSSINFFKEEN